MSARRIVGMVKRGAFGNRKAIHGLDRPFHRPIIAVQPVTHEAQRFGGDVQATVREKQLDQRDEQGVGPEAGSR